MKKVTINKDGHYEFDETPAVIQPFSIHLEKLRDELALDEAQFCHCSGGACSGCEKSTIKIFKQGFDKGAEEMAKIKDAQIEKLVEALSGILEIGKRDMSNPKYDGYFETATKALDNFRKEVK